MTLTGGQQEDAPNSAMALRFHAGVGGRKSVAAG
jgi:hypothetical protein